MTEIEVKELASQRSERTDDGKYVFSPSQLQDFAGDLIAGAYRGLHELAMGPAEHALIDDLPTRPFDTLAGNPVAIPLDAPEMVEVMGMDEASWVTMSRARAIERAVLAKNRLREPS